MTTYKSMSGATLTKATHPQPAQTPAKPLTPPQNTGGLPSGFAGLNPDKPKQTPTNLAT